MLPSVLIAFMEKQIFGGPYFAIEAGYPSVKFHDLRKHIKD